MTSIKDLSVDDLKNLIENTVKATIEQTLDEYLEDSDFQQNLKPEVKQRLIESQQKTEAGEKGVSLTEVINQLKIKE